MNAELIANGLRMEYPDIYTRLIAKISDMVPVTDNSPDIRRLITKYCNYHGIDRQYLRASSSHRKRLLAVCILNFQPEKMAGYSHRRLKNGIISEISKYCGCGTDSLKKWVGEIIFQYGNVSDFKRDVDEITFVLKKFKNNFDYQ